MQGRIQDLCKRGGRPKRDFADTTHENRGRGKKLGLKTGSGGGGGGWAP